MIDDLDYFLLELVSDFRLDLSVFSLDDIGCAFNVRVPRFALNELICAIGELFERGDLDARLSVPPGSRARPRPVRLTPDTIEAGIAGALPIEFGLTAQGGERWAALHSIDWQRWEEDCWSRIRFGVIRASTRSFAEALLSDEFERGMAREPVAWREVRPWRPTYWHEEAVGYEVRYRLQRDPNTHTWKTTALRLRPELAPRRLRTAAPEDRPFSALNDRQVQSRIWRRRDALASLAAVTELARRRGQRRKLIELLETTCPIRRFAAARALGAAKARDAVPALLNLAMGRHDIAAVEALASIGDRWAVGPLLTLFRWFDSPFQSERAFSFAVGRALVSFGDHGVTAIQRLMSVSPRLLERGLYALSHSQSPGAVEALLRHADHWLAIPALAEMGNNARRQLYALAVDETATPRVRGQAARALAQSPGVFAAEAAQLLNG